MAKKTYTLTQAGFDELTSEYERLSEVERPQLLIDIEDARSLGDLKENEAYHAARNKLSYMQGRLEELESILANAQVVEPDSKGGKIVIGSTIMVEVGSDEREFIIVEEQEADLAIGKISTSSPLGQALLGAKQGDSVVFEAPSGSVEYKVTAVS